MWSSNIFQVTRQYIFVCGRLADIPRQQLRRSGSCYTSRTAKLLNCFLRIFKLLQLWHAVIPTLSVRFNIRCLVQKGLFCWLIHLINPINYFGDFHNTLQSSSCTMCRVCTDFNISEQRFIMECYVCSSYLNLLSVLSNCVGFAFLKNLARCSIHTQCPQSLQIRASWESFLHKHGTEQNILVPQIVPSVPQPVVQSRRSPLLGPSPGWKRLLALSHLRHY